MAKSNDSLAHGESAELAWRKLRSSRRGFFFFFLPDYELIITLGGLIHPHSR